MFLLGRDRPLPQRRQVKGEGRCGRGQVSLCHFTPSSMTLLSYLDAYRNPQFHAQPCSKSRTNHQRQVHQARLLQLELRDSVLTRIALSSWFPAHAPAADCREPGPPLPD